LLYNGKLRATCWPKRYCTYFSTGSNVPWLHSNLVKHEIGYEIHHINGVSSDNRLENLHFLTKKEHNSLSHPLIDERKKMFLDPKTYWKKRKLQAIATFVLELGLIITEENRQKFIIEFAKFNLPLANEILSFSNLPINLTNIEHGKAQNRADNPHLPTDYLDAYEIEKYIADSKIKVNSNRRNPEGQLRMF